MSGYLARLKSEKLSTPELPKMPKGSFDSLDSTKGRCFSKITPLLPATEEEMFDMIRQTVEELNVAADWSGFRNSLTPGQWQRIRDAERRIDSTYGERHRERLAAALVDYRKACLQARGRQPSRSQK